MWWNHLSNFASDNILVRFLRLTCRWSLRAAQIKSDQTGLKNASVKLGAWDSRSIYKREMRGYCFIKTAISTLNGIRNDVILRSAWLQFQLKQNGASWVFLFLLISRIVLNSITYKSKGCLRNIIYNLSARRKGSYMYLQKLRNFYLSTYLYVFCGVIIFCLCCSWLNYMQNR